LGGPERRLERIDLVHELAGVPLRGLQLPMHLLRLRL
jgi:hypothetical protein